MSFTALFSQSSQGSCIAFAKMNILEYSPPTSPLPTISLFFRTSPYTSPIQLSYTIPYILDVLLFSWLGSDQRCLEREHHTFARHLLLRHTRTMQCWATSLLDLPSSATHSIILFSKHIFLSVIILICIEKVWDYMEISVSQQPSP